MQLGDWQLDIVRGGSFRLDGGALFGVVPKVLWENVAVADEQNRILCQTNCVLARDGHHTVLVDTGYGGKASARERDRHGLQPGEPLVAELDRLGVLPEQVQTVALSHLHFDHAGGGVRRDGRGTLVPAFPKADYAVGRLEWELATSGAAELAGAYPQDNILPLKASGQLRLVEDGEEIAPGLTAVLTGGHTAGHLALKFHSTGQTAVYMGDICPTTAHLGRMWCMSYDTHPLQTRRVKAGLLTEAAHERWWIVFSHDAQMPIGRIAQDARGEFVVADTPAESAVSRGH